MGLDRFINQWMIPDYPPRPVSDEGLQEVENRFGFSFPADYRNEVLRHGLVSPTIELLDVIVDGKLDIADLSQLLEPEEMIESTEGWREMGLPDNLVAFGSDCMGNLFCFNTSKNGPVFFFDHDFGTNEMIAPSFAAWIDAFCTLKANDS